MCVKNVQVGQCDTFPAPRISIGPTHQTCRREDDNDRICNFWSLPVCSNNAGERSTNEMPCKRQMRLVPGYISSTTRSHLWHRLDRNLTRQISPTSSFFHGTYSNNLPVVRTLTHLYYTVGLCQNFTLLLVCAADESLTHQLDKAHTYIKSCLMLMPEGRTGLHGRVFEVRALSTLPCVKKP